MGQDSKIEWCKHTFNPWRGCTKVSPGCKFCYADTMSKRNPGVLGVWGPAGTRVIASASYWRQPLLWNRRAEAAGERARVFCASMADVFEGTGTTPEASWLAVAEARERLWELIEATEYLDWLLLTKRPENITHAIPDAWRERGCPPNVWMGTSVESQEAADARIPALLQVPARIRFLSCEPLLGPVGISAFLWRSDFVMTQGGAAFPCRKKREGIHWVIVGGESGPKARPMHPDWARGLRDQAQAASVPFFFKQWGEHHPVEWNKADPKPAVALSRDGSSVYAQVGHVLGFRDPGDACMERVGKHAAGRQLDGREWNEVPS